MRHRTFFIIGVLFFNISASANEPKVEKCTVIENPNIRLKCYDSIFKKDTKSATISAPSSVPPSMQNSQRYYRPPPRNINVKPLQPPAKVENSIGDTKRLIEEPKTEKDSKIAAKIISVKQLASYKLDITLDNGQVWRTVESIYKIKIKKSQDVIISEALCGADILKVVDRKIALRVRRVK